MLYMLIGAEIKQIYFDEEKSDVNVRKNDNMNSA